MHNVKWSGSQRGGDVLPSTVSSEHGSPRPQHLPPHCIWCQGTFYRWDVAVYGSVLHKHLRCSPCWRVGEEAVKIVELSMLDLSDLDQSRSLFDSFIFHVILPLVGKGHTWSSVSHLNLLKKNVVFYIFPSSSWWKTEEEGYRSLWHTVHLYS